MPHDEQKAAGMSLERGRIAALIKDPERRKRFIARQGELETKKRGYTPEVHEDLSQELHRVRNQAALGIAENKYLFPSTKYRRG